MNRLIVFCMAFAVATPALAQEPREMRDQRDVKKQQFLKRLPLQSTCRAEVAGGVVRPEGKAAWESGAFEVESEDNFRVTISMIEQIPPLEQQTCEAQAKAIEHDDVQRTIYLEKGDIVCMKRIYNDKRRLPQLTACTVSALLTQPTHLRCKNLDPILDPDGIYISPNHMMVITLPQAVMTKGVCRAADTP